MSNGGGNGGGGSGGGGGADEGKGFAALFEEQAAVDRAGGRKRRRNAKPGDRVEGVVVQVGKDSVFVEIDGKQQAYIENDGSLGDVKVGDTIAAVVVEADERHGQIRLARTLARGETSGVGALEQARDAGLAVEGKVSALNKGGLEIDLGGVRAFCPLSQTATRTSEDARALVGQVVRVLVTEVADGGRRVVVSRRALAEREAAEAQERAASELTIGAVTRGTVTGVRDFGAFVDLGGVEGLVPRSEIAHDRNVAPADALAPGDVVEVQVQAIKRDENDRLRITLSLKALAKEPETAVAARAAAQAAQAAIVVGAVVRGTVDRVEPYGVFVQVDGTSGRGGRGLVPSAELGVPRGTDLRKAFPPGTAVTAKVLETADGRIRMSLRAAKEAEERAQFEEARGKASAPKTLGTLGDLLKKKGR